MITYSNIAELKVAKNAIEILKNDYPVLFEKFLDAIYLTRALQFKYHYMGCLLMDKNPGESNPSFVYASVLRVYEGEIQKIKDDQDFQILKQTISNISNSNFSKLCLLILGEKPEALVGVSNIR